MPTFKQLEAIYWVVRTGGFAQATNKLHTTQSAVSKRVQELDSLFDTPLFDRSLRTARLTEKGEEMYAMAKRLLEQRDAAVEQFQRPFAGCNSVGVMSWFLGLRKNVERVCSAHMIE